MTMTPRLVRWRFLFATVALWAWMFLAPYVTVRWGVQLLLQLFLVQFVVVTLWANPRWGAMRNVLIGAWLVSLASAVAMALPLADQSGRLARSAQCLALVPLLALLALGILRYVFSRRQLDADSIFATIAAYLLIAPAPMDLQFWPGAVAMVLINTVTVFLVANGGRSAWYLGVMLLVVYATFGMTLYLLPPTTG